MLPSAVALTSYANEFFTPESVWRSSWVGNATWAKSTVVEDAQWIAAQGPWSGFRSGRRWYFTHPSF